MYFSLCVGIMCLSLFCYVLLCVHSTFCNCLEEEENAGSFAFVVFLMSCYVNVLRLFLTVQWDGPVCSV